ncbi:hypothetical protein QQF64_017405 [Cirrhinus molitorella]|uniref:Uncharacterized protein n=1 Tax=Cirrhinus molitorella TaxID=172907 RepID=A0ABR3LIK6_9TELE
MRTLFPVLSMEERGNVEQRGAGGETRLSETELRASVAVLWWCLEVGWRSCALEETTAELKCQHRRHRRATAGHVSYNCDRTTSRVGSDRRDEVTPQGN